MSTTIDERPPASAAVKPDLKAAVRRARVQDAERGDVVSDLREAAFARLDVLADRLDPVFAQVPPEVDLFDHGIVAGERPRLYVDLLGFIEVDRDRRTYRFMVDTRHGRQLLASSEDPDAIAAAVTDYIARRIVEREKAIAADRTPQTPSAEPSALPPPSHHPARFTRGDLVFAFMVGLLAGAAIFYAALWWQATHQYL